MRGQGEKGVRGQGGGTYCYAVALPWGAVLGVVPRQVDVVLEISPVPVRREKIYHPHLTTKVLAVSVHVPFYSQEYVGNAAQRLLGAREKAHWY